MSRIHCLNTAVLQEEGRVRCAAAIPVWTKQVPTSHFHPKEDVQRARIFQSIFIKHKKSVYNDHFYCKSWLTGKKKKHRKNYLQTSHFFFSCIQKMLKEWHILKIQIFLNALQVFLARFAFTRISSSAGDCWC